MSEADELKKLAWERGQIKATLTRFISFLEKCTNENITNLDIRLQSIESLLADFNKVQSKIELLKVEEIESGEREGFEDRYFDAVSQAKQMIELYQEQKYRESADHSRSESGSHSGSNRQGSTNSQEIRAVTNISGFPTIELIKFNGEYDKWPQFRALFVSLVHNDCSLDNVRKFYYLLSSLKGEAAKVLESIEITDENYAIAWSLLNERYDNKTLTIKNNVSALFEIPTVNREKYTLRNLLDDFHKRYRALKLLGEDVEHWDTLLIHLITTKLDARTATAWEELIINRKIERPKLNQLIDFITDRCVLAENTKLKRNDEKIQTNTSFNKASGVTNKFSKFRKNSQSFVVAKAADNKATNVQCVLCKEAHHLYQCKKFIELAVPARKRELESLKVCSNCLRSSHSLDRCSAQGCKVCAKRHNTLIHADVEEPSAVNLNIEPPTRLSSGGETSSAVSSSLSINHCSDRAEQRTLASLSGVARQRITIQFLNFRNARKLKVKATPINIPVVGVGAAQTNITSRACVEVKSIDEKYRIELQCLIIDKITEHLPSESFSKNQLNIPRDITLADEDFNKSSKIDIKWGSNEPRVLEALIENSDHCLYEDEVKRTLGLIWRAYSDELTYSVDQRDITVTKVTKRGLLSAISRIFDPLGLISPVILRFKILLQQLWELKLSWDDNLPDAIANEWKQISADLPTLNDVKINRHVIISNPKYIELHCFSDASQYGYGACVYVKSVNANNEVEIHLICSKSRVAPLKTITIPRLELCGALLATRLHERVKASLLLNIDTSYFWTDSMIVLSWLKMQPSSLKVFVANRVAEIQRHTTVEQWGHVPTSQNPADLASRGSSPSEIRVSNIWWSGPEWLKLSSQFWPKLSSTQPNTIPETKIPKIVLHLSNPQHFDVVDRFSSLYKLQRVIALIHRFCFNCRHSKAKRIVGNISVEEMDLAMKSLIRIAQQQTYNDEIQDIESGKNVSRRSKLLTLNPVIDEHGLLRVGGRLINSKLPYASKHQIILAPKHPLTRLIIITEHYRNMHAGILQLLGSLRKTYWIVHGRRAIRSILRSCLICYRANPKTIKCKMGDFPEDRWNFIPPRSPHHGGLWEAAVKRAKFHLTRVVGKQTLTFEEFSTVAAQVEAVMNSRPLTPISSDPSDLSVLTPGHFLIGDTLLAPPQHDYSDVPNNRLDQYQRIQQMHQTFWRRWSYDYLMNLQTRSKWSTNPNQDNSIKQGSMVILVEDNLPPLYWHLGRVSELHTGSDGNVRVVTVKTASGYVKRAVQKLCLLPIEH
nr:unnamed protein product [Callosobruchus analis]